MILEEIKKIVKEACIGKEDIFENHVLNVVKYSRILAEKLNIDSEVVEIAAYLHDIMKIEGCYEKHHVLGSEKAITILTALNYPVEKIEIVRKCILTHSSDQTYPPESIEEKIVASADALAIFDTFLAMTYVVYNLKKMSIEEGRKWLLNKYAVAWGKLIPEAQEIAQEKYEKIKEFLN
jgi:uncharacterized protein